MTTTNQPAKPTFGPGSTLAMMSLFQGISGAYSDYQLAKTQKDIANYNSRLAEQKGRDAMRRGDEAVARVRQRTNLTVGRQRAALAAQGIDANVGSARDIQREAQDFGEMDALTVRTNARREAFGYQAEAVSVSLQGTLAASATRQRGTQTLLGGGVRGLAYYERYK